MSPAPERPSCFLITVICLYSTLLPQAGRQLELRWRASQESHPSEELSEPQYGSIIMGWRDHGETACQSCLGLSGYRSTPYLAVL